MIHEVDVDAILTELQALAEKTTGAAAVAVLARMDVVDRHAKIVDEHEIAERLAAERGDPPPLLVQQRVTMTGYPVELTIDEPDRIGPRSWDRRRR